MIEGGWAYIAAAYALTITALCVLVAIVATRLAHWAARARAQGRKDAP